MNLTGDFRGAFLRPPCTLSNQVFRGGHPVFQGGQAPSGPLIIRPLHIICHARHAMLHCNSLQTSLKSRRCDLQCSIDLTHRKQSCSDVDSLPRHVTVSSCTRHCSSRRCIVVCSDVIQRKKTEDRRHTAKYQGRNIGRSLCTLYS